MTMNLSRSSTMINRSLVKVVSNSFLFFLITKHLLVGCAVNGFCHRNTILIEYLEYLIDFISWFHSTIKTVLNQKQVTFHQIVHVLDAFVFRTMYSEQK
jgi:hypothetical protein